MFVCLQAGHEGRTTGATGAPGEQELTVRIRNRVSQLLIDRGFVIQLVNADPKPAEIAKDFDLFLAIHGDANIYGTGGGCIASADKSVDMNYQRSAQIRDAIASEYFEHAEIVNHPERINPKMTLYYMWDQLSAKTPCVVIELGVVQDAHDTVLLHDTERIAGALARGICKAFNVNYEAAPEPTQPQPAQTESVDELKKQLKDLRTELSTKETEWKGLLAAKDTECAKKIEAYKLEIKAALIKWVNGY